MHTWPARSLMTPAAAQHPALAPWVLVRVAGLPFATTRRLSGLRTAAAARALDTLEAELAALGDDLCARLFTAAGRCEDTDARRRLLAVKRAVFNARPVADEVVRAAATAAGPHLAPDLRAWAERRHRLHALVRAGEAAVVEDRAATDAELRRLAADPVVGTGLLFAQPHLFDELARASEAPATRDSPTLTRTLAAYCYRAATKTSPFSTFTSTAVRRADDADAVDDHPAARRAVCTLNAAVIESLDTAIAAHPETGALLPLHPNDAATRHGDRVWSLGTSRPVHGPAAPFGRDERLVEIGLSPFVELALDLVTSRPGHWTTASLEERLGAEAPDTATRARLARALGQLVDHGLLRRSLGYDAADPDGLAQLAASSSLACTPRGKAVQEALRDAAEALPALACAAPGPARELLLSVHGHVVRAFEALDADPERPRQQGLVHHDSYLAAGSGPSGPPRPGLLPGVAVRPPGGLDRAMPGLARWHAVLPLFDAALPWRRHVQAFSRTRCAAGAERDLIDLYREFCESDADVALGPSESEPGRRALLTALHRVGASVTGDEGEIPASLLDRFADRARPFRPPTAAPSAGYLGQLWRAPVGGPRFVLNQVVPGYGTMSARTVGVPDHAWLADALRESRGAVAPDADVVDLVGTFGFDGQLHPRIERRRLVYPGEAVRPGPEVIGWNDVVAAADPATGVVRLRHRRTGRWLLPLSTGTLSPRLVPSFFLFVLAFGPAFMPHLQSADLLGDGRSGDEGAGDEQDTPEYHPRLCHDGVVLRRRTWRVSSEAVPWRGRAGRPGFADFRRARAWAREQDLPRRVFVSSGEADEHSGARTASRRRAKSKPFFVDWDDISTHELLHRFAGPARGTVTITEMLPVPDEDRHVVEYLLELTG